jgi:general secretion pathway protein E
MSDASPAESPFPRLLGQMLIARGCIADSDLERALSYQRMHGGQIGSILIRLGALSEESLLPVLAEQTGYTLVSLTDIPSEYIMAAIQRLRWPWDRVQSMALIPWDDPASGLHAASANPLDSMIQETLESDASDPVTWHFARGHELERLIVKLRSGQGAQDFSTAQYREMAEDAPIIAFVNSLFAQAVDERASDIHIEPGELVCEVRFRIDGVLHSRFDFSMDRYPAVASRIKLIAGLDIAERRLSQDGRITLRASGAEMDMRVSVIPAVHGESLVMRLLPKKREDLSLSALGLEPDHLHLLRSWLDMPNGLILVTGPTGSGKSTTLYSALAAIDDRRRKIITVEDPVEHRLPGIIQIQTQEEINFTFARALRSILRHDPDIIMIGEIRDRETAEIAIQSALTGHLVLSTLHTNDALSAFTRLVDMGIEPFLVAASVQAVMAQRLVRRMCPHCARPTIAPPMDIQLPDANWREPAGCEHCQNTGYRGRLGLYELVTVNAAMRHAIAAQASLRELETVADAAGRRALRDDGLLKASRGQTSVAEVFRVSGGEVLE